MDPLTAISLASAIVQFIDFSSKLVSGAREIYVSASGDTEENRSVEVITTEMKALSLRLSPTSSSRSEDEKSLSRLAAECEIVSGQILELLNKIKPKDSTSRRQSVWAAFKNKLQEREKAELETRLHNCRSQLGLQLNFLMSSETRHKLDSLISSAEGDTATLGILQSDIEQLTRGVTVTSISPETQTQIKEALDLSGRAYETAAQQRILRSLSFVDMYGRFEAVDIAHYKTFEWIFEDKPEHTKNDYNFSHRETFLHWLSAGTGIFHISGKLGSGKSTLMKFLCSHERTSVELEKWAGDRKLVFAKFFFWKPGTTLQRSLGGLFRSLLHDTLETHPELIPAVLPDQWARLKSTPWHIQTDLHLSNEDIRVAFSRLIKHRNLYRNHCFCFFIDGLDEFEEPFKDSKDMINLLISWTEVAPEDVKICVSSREYNAFQDSFSDERRLCLQDLTRDDMERYIRDRLSDMRTKDKASIEPFAKAVARKANGIFLWTTLVVKSLRERLGDGYELDFLEQELDSIPEELEHLFKYLLRSIAKPARKSAYRTFAMVMEARTWELEISLASYYFFNHYETDKEFAMQPSFRIARPKEQSEAARRDMARKRLNGCCRGLLELSTHQGHFTIVFTHRSVPEFLESPETIIQMGLYLRNFSPIDAISQLFLAEVLMADSASMNIGSLSIRTYSVLRMLHQSKADWAPYHFRDTCLHTAVLELQGKDTKDPSLGYGRIIVKPDSYFTSIAGDYDESAVVSPLHISAFLGDYDYIAWKLGCDSTIIETDLKKYLLIRWIMHGAVYVGNIGCFKLLGLFLSRGLLPQTVLHTQILIPGYDGDVELTFWQSFILVSALEYIPMHDMRSFKWHARISGFGGEYHQNFGEIIEKFLRLGADLDLWMWVPDDSRALISAGSCANVQYDHVRASKSEVTLGIERKKIVLEAQISRSTYELINSKDGRISLRDLIVFWKLENTEILLQLIDKKMEQQEHTSGDKIGVKRTLQVALL